MEVNDKANPIGIFLELMWSKCTPWWSSVVTWYTYYVNMISLHLNLPNTGIMVRWRSPWTYIIHNQNRMYVTGTTYQVLSHGYTCYFKQITALYSPANLPCYHSPTRSLTLPAGKILFTLSWDKWLTKCLNTSSIGSFRFWKYSFFSPITLPDITSELSVVPLCDTVEPLSWRNL